MPRRERIPSTTGYYHIVARGINKNDLFLYNDDKDYFLSILAAKKEKEEYLLHAYCLMDNHVHLLLQEGSEDVATTMKRINVSYAMYFNNKYQRALKTLQLGFILISVAIIIAVILSFWLTGYCEMWQNAL